MAAARALAVVACSGYRGRALRQDGSGLPERGASSYFARQTMVEIKMPRRADPPGQTRRIWRLTYQNVATRSSDFWLITQRSRAPVSATKRWLSPSPILLRVWPATRGFLIGRRLYGWRDRSCLRG